MALTGNTYGSKVARVGVPVLLALDVGGTGVLVWEARICAIDGSGNPIIGRVGVESFPSVSYSFQATADESEVDALTSGEWTWPLASRHVVGLASGASSSDVSAVPADGWKDVYSKTHDSVGGTSLSIQWKVVADVVIGGKARLVISGGAFGTGTQIGPEVAFVAMNSSPISTFDPAPLAVTSGTTYTTTIQVQAVGTLASVAVSSTSSPTTNGARIGLIEYH